jgi:hypothetical protein
MLTFLKKQDIDYCVIDLMKLRGPTFANAELCCLSKIGIIGSMKATTIFNFSFSLLLIHGGHTLNPKPYSSSVMHHAFSLKERERERERERENTNISGCSFLSSTISNALETEEVADYKIHE